MHDSDLDDSARSRSIRLPPLKCFGRVLTASLRIDEAELDRSQCILVNDAVAGRKPSPKPNDFRVDRFWKENSRKFCVTRDSNYSLSLFATPESQRSKLRGTTLAGFDQTRFDGRITAWPNST